MKTFTLQETASRGIGKVTFVLNSEEEIWFEIQDSTSQMDGGYGLEFRPMEPYYTAIGGGCIQFSKKELKLLTDLQNAYQQDYKALEKNSKQRTILDKELESIYSLEIIYSETFGDWHIKTSKQKDMVDKNTCQNIYNVLCGYFNTL